MSVVPPLVALAGGGIPKALLDLMPEISPLKSLLGSVFLFNAPHMVRVYYMAKAAGGFGKVKNENPRAQYDEVKGDKDCGEAMVRAQAAHLNGMESFPVFAAGVLAATAAGVDKKTVGRLAAFHLLSRTAFNVLYIGFSTPAPAIGRSIAWVCSLLSSCQLIALAAACQS